MSSTWHNRIVGHEEVAPDQLLAHPLNFRLHPKHQQDALRGVIADIGYIRSVLVNRTTGRVIDGHLRVTLALRDDVPLIPVEYVELTEPEEAEALATFDALTGLATLDAGNLDALLREVTTGDANVQQLLDDLATAAGLVPGVDEQAPGLGGDEFDTTPAGGPTRTSVGDLWQLGRHRLLVGDCTIKEQVDRLMDGKRLRMVWTDPPYGVSYADKNEFLNKMDKGNRNQTPIQNDHMSEDETRQLAQAAFTLACNHAERGAAIYVACPPGTLLPHFIAAVAASGFTFKHSLAWVKNQFVLGRCDYHYRHETILYGWIENGAHYFVDDHTQDSVIEVDKPRSSVDHPTMKPVELVERMINNSSRKGEIVYDSFLGSGTTLIATERTGRTCYGCEIEPKYADVILRRWEAESGLVAVKVDNNQLVGS